MVPNLEPIPLPFLGGTEHDGLRACCLESAKDAVSGVWGIDSDADRYASENKRVPVASMRTDFPSLLRSHSKALEWTGDLAGFEKP